MKYLSYQEWKKLGYIVKKGEHASKVDDDYKSTYLFSEDQVVLIGDKTDTKKNIIFKDIINLIDSRFEIYFKGSYVGEFSNEEELLSSDWVLECKVKSIEPSFATDFNDNAIIEIQLID